MISVRLCRDGELFAGVEVSGHAGYAEDGSDIVCAAVTGAVRLLECVLNDAMGLGADASATGARAAVVLSAEQARRGGVQDILRGFALYMEQLAREYPENIRII